MVDKLMVDFEIITFFWDFEIMNENFQIEFYLTEFSDI